MKTIKRTAFRDFYIKEVGIELKIKKGCEYTTSPEGQHLVIGPGPIKGHVTVYKGSVWGAVPVDVFQENATDTVLVKTKDFEKLINPIVYPNHEELVEAVLKFVSKYMPGRIIPTKSDSNAT